MSVDVLSRLGNGPFRRCGFQDVLESDMCLAGRVYIVRLVCKYA